MADAKVIDAGELPDVLTALNDTLWDTSGVLSDQSVLGVLLHTLIGYVDRPTTMQVAVYAATVIIMIGLMRYVAPPARRPAAA